MNVWFWLSRLILAAAGGVVWLDIMLPSWITWYFDEMIMAGLIWLMRWVTQKETGR